MKIGILGYYAYHTQDFGGQPVKTRIFTEELKTVLGDNQVKSVDTFNWTSNVFRLFISCFKLFRTCENITILPASNGIKVFAPLFVFLNLFFKRKLHYIVIGGWLPELLEDNPLLKNIVSKFDGVYVETHSMVKALQRIGLNNVKYLPNFKRLEIIEESTLKCSKDFPLRLCTFSRVTKTKGIEDAIEAVKIVNSSLGKVVYELDIYGQVDEDYKDRFNELKKDFPEYISYKGIAKYNESVNVIKDYFALLFPTYYKGEGFPGTVLDAFAAGVPVIATNWRYNGEIIKDQKDGLIYDNKERGALQKILFSLKTEPNQINNMKSNCLKRAKQYTPETVINSFLNYL
jgi:glycosyltransferase involved in cell wall biosynthesis